VASPVASAPTTPAKPTSVHAAASGGAVTVRWRTNAASAGMQVVIVVRAHGKVVRKVVLPAGTSHVTLRNLPAGARYTFTVTLVAANGGRSTSLVSKPLLLMG